MTRLFPVLTVALFLLPVGAGLLGTLLPSLGVGPGLERGIGLTPWRDLLAAPGLGRAVALSLVIGVGSAVVSLTLVLLIAALGHGGAVPRWSRRALAPLLAVPHVAMALGAGVPDRALGLDRPPAVALGDRLDAAAGYRHGSRSLGSGRRCRAGSEGNALSDADAAGGIGAGQGRRGRPCRAYAWSRSRAGVAARGAAPGLSAAAPAGLCRSGLCAVGGGRGACPGARNAGAAGGVEKGVCAGWGMRTPRCGLRAPPARSCKPVLWRWSSPCGARARSLWRGWRGRG